MTEATLLNRLKKFGYGQHHGPMAKACAEAANEIDRLQTMEREVERLLAAVRATEDSTQWFGPIAALLSLERDKEKQVRE